MQEDVVSHLLAWCRDNDVHIDPRITVERSNRDDCTPGGLIHDAQDSDSDAISQATQILVRSKDQYIESGVTLVHIPKRAVLSVRSCSLARHLTFVPYGHEAHLMLALAVCGELLRGRRSRWYAYLLSLPQDAVDIPLLWASTHATPSHICEGDTHHSPDTEEEHMKSDAAESKKHDVIWRTRSGCSACDAQWDGSEALLWLKQTEVDKEIHGLSAKIDCFIVENATPVLQEAFPEAAAATKRDERKKLFYYAYSLVTSRAFWVDSFHGLAMVPVADAFNHTIDNHVHLESDYDVCVECGSLAECEHDREEVIPESSRDLSGSADRAAYPLFRLEDLSAEAEDVMEMRTVLPIPPNSEVFNTYGSLPNATLLARYGFVLDGNDLDIVNMNTCATSGEPSLSDKKHIARLLAAACNLDVTAVLERLSGLDITKACSALNEIQLKDSSAITGARTFYKGLDCVASNIVETVSTLAGVWPSEPRWDELDEGEEIEPLIYNPPSCHSGRTAHPDNKALGSVDLTVSCDGKISHPLWLYCIVVATIATSIQYSPRDIHVTLAHPPSLLQDLGSLPMLSGANFRDAIARIQMSFLYTQEWVEKGFELSVKKEQIECIEDEGLKAAEYERDTQLLREQQGALSARGPGLGQAQSLLGCPREHKEMNASEIISSRSRDVANAGIDPLGSLNRSPKGVGGMNVGTGEERPSKRARLDHEDGERVTRNCRIGPSPEEGDSEETVFQLDQGFSAEHPDKDTLLTPNELAICRDIGTSLVRVVIFLCRERYRSLGTITEEQPGYGMTAAQLGDLLDAAPTWMRRTRTALGLAIGERSVVESCAASWASKIGEDESPEEQGFEDM